MQISNFPHTRSWTWTNGEREHCGCPFVCEKTAEKSHTGENENTVFCVLKQFTFLAKKREAKKAMMKKFHAN
jgi:hypothetical protein